MGWEKKNGITNEVDVMLPELMISLVFRLEGLLRTICFCERESELRVEGGICVGF